MLWTASTHRVCFAVDIGVRQSQLLTSLASDHALTAAKQLELFARTCVMRACWLYRRRLQTARQPDGRVYSSQKHHDRMTDRIKILRPTRHKIGQFGDVLPSQSLGLVLKKLNLTLEKQTIQEQNGINRKRQKKTYKKQT